MPSEPSPKRPASSAAKASRATRYPPYQHLTVWLARAAFNEDPSFTTRPSTATPVVLPQFPAQTLLPWLFLGGFLATAAGLVVDL